jgi:hypothetical protein
VTRHQRRARRPRDPQRLRLRVPATAVRLDATPADPRALGRSEALAGWPKTGSEAWVERGCSASSWFGYSQGYDGARQL